LVKVACVGRKRTCEEQGEHDGEDEEEADRSAQMSPRFVSTPQAKLARPRGNDDVATHLNPALAAARSLAAIGALGEVSPEA